MKIPSNYTFSTLCVPPLLQPFPAARVLSALLLPLAAFSRLAKPAFIPPHFGNTITTLSTMVSSKRDPTIDAGQYAADRLEKLLDEDGFKKWGFVIYLIYRCTYQNNTDRQNFMDHFVSAVPRYLEFYNGLDLLDTSTTTVLEDPLL